jgi:hypothetical protein
MPLTGTPQNFLFQKQWNLQIIKAPKAWLLLRDLSQGRGVGFGDADDLTFGSNKILAAIIDQGIETNAPAIAVNPAFSGDVTGAM